MLFLTYMLSKKKIQMNHECDFLFFFYFYFLKIFFFFFFFSFSSIYFHKTDK